MEPICLGEYEDWVGNLLPEDAEFISLELSPKITIRRDLQTPQFLLNPNQFVGVISLPSGRSLESKTKVPVANLFYMLAVAFNFPSPFRDKAEKFDRLDEILEFIASYFAELLEDRIDRGLYRSYLPF